MTQPLLLDVIGDVHGHLAGLLTLCRDLGYDVEGDGSHPDGRLLLFVGDLIDRGPQSLEVAEHVAALVQKDLAMCLLGNHEYNLVAWHQGHQSARTSNGATISDVARRPERWEAVLTFFSSLPIALQLPGLRVIHAVWHEPCVRRVTAALASSENQPTTPLGKEARPIDRLRAAVAIGSPFLNGALREELPQAGVPPASDCSHEILIKGFEEQAAQPFEDADGHRRTLIRVCWWLGQRAEIPTDGVTVFGHYWNLPPKPDSALFAPPYPAGHPESLRWEREHAPEIPRRGQQAVPAHESFVCIDYNGMLRHGDVGCIGAYRWPEHRVAWAFDS
ncbi:MAG: hypothetical protein ACI9EF_003627 [Pseudohongiellaceae bacterium]